MSKVRTRLMNLKNTFVNLYKTSTYKIEYNEGLILKLNDLKNKFAELDNNCNKKSSWICSLSKSSIPKTRFKMSFRT